MATMGAAARAAAATLATASTATKNAALAEAAAAIRAAAPAILAANAEDVADGRAAGLSPAMLDRLALNEARIAAMARGLEEVAALPDPIGDTIAR
ncbi:MAG: gamma-glutamyl-phosphate reductase, partial [Alphaproteobacteria bacterium]